MCNISYLLMREIVQDDFLNLLKITLSIFADYQTVLETISKFL